MVPRTTHPIATSSTENPSSSRIMLAPNVQMAVLDRPTRNELFIRLTSPVGVGPVHLVVQDISGGAGVRLASAHPESLLSFTGIETGLAGFGLEMLADVAKGGAWYIGLLATPGAAETFFKGREQVLIGDFIMPAATVVRNAVTPRDVAELARGYAGEGGWSGALALYGSMLREAEAIRAIAKDVPLTFRRWRLTAPEAISRCKRCRLSIEGGSALRPSRVLGITSQWKPRTNSPRRYWPFSEARHSRRIDSQFLTGLEP